MVGGIYPFPNWKQGHVFEYFQVAGSPMFVVQAYVPENEILWLYRQGKVPAKPTAGLSRSACLTNGRSCSEIPLTEAGNPSQVGAETDEHKGLTEGIPAQADLLDKL